MLTVYPATALCWLPLPSLRPRISSRIPPIYCIGLIGADGLNVEALNSWATDPDASHVAVTPDAADLEELFAELAANITKTGATNIRIDEVVSPDFIITSILPPGKGEAKMLDVHNIKWTISELGVSGSESALL